LVLVSIEDEVVGMGILMTKGKTAERSKIAQKFVSAKVPPKMVEKLVEKRVWTDSGLHDLETLARKLKEGEVSSETVEYLSKRPILTGGMVKMAILAEVFVRAGVPRDVANKIITDRWETKSGRNSLRSLREDIRKGRLKKDAVEELAEWDVYA
jgi:hypothetical protein